MNPSNCTWRTPLILGLTLEVKSTDVSFELVHSMKPTSGLKFGPIFRRSTIPSSQFDRYDSDAPASLRSGASTIVCGIGTLRVVAMWPPQLQNSNFAPQGAPKSFRSDQTGLFADSTDEVIVAKIVP